MKFILAIFMLIFMFRPFNTIFFVVTSILLSCFLYGESFIAAALIYFSLASLIILYCLSQIFLPLMRSNLSAIHRKYFVAIHWNLGAEMFSFLCSNFAMLNVIWTIKTVYYGYWWTIIYSILFYLIYSFFIGERLNPYLFLGDRVNAGDLYAAETLKKIHSIRQHGVGSFYW